MTQKFTTSLKGFFEALFEPAKCRPAAQTRDQQAQSEDSERRDGRRDDSLFWGWSMYGHW